MKRNVPFQMAKIPWILTGLVTAALLLVPEHEVKLTQSVIVQGDNLAAVRAAVDSAGGTITHDLGLIGGVAATLTNAQLAQLKNIRAISRITVNAGVETAAKPLMVASQGELKLASNTANDNGLNTETYFPSLIDADLLHRQGIDGSGVTLAVLDSGLWDEKGISNDINGANRIVSRYDAIVGNQLDLAVSDDNSGHGTHVTSIAVSSRQSDNGNYNGIAPDIDLVSVKALDADGRGTYADVIRGIGWLVKNKDRYKIRVLNLSLSAEAQSHYWNDPLGQAVMAAWKAGIVVVASAGNTGPTPMSIGVPGNIPYVITVGAMTDNYTPANGGDDKLAGFSSAGPTREAFVKPEIVAPGGHLIGIMQSNAQIAEQHPEFHDGAKYFSMSGTSQATAVVSGVVALMLEVDPTLTPDNIKCRLMASAHPATDSQSQLLYSPFQQGAGLINAYDAVYSNAADCANRGLNISRDLSGTEHYAGAARQDASGNYYIEDYSGSIWDGNYNSNDSLWTDGFVWNDGFVWRDGFVLSEGFVWRDSLVWNDGFVWRDGFLMADAQSSSIAINNWVTQE